MSKKCPRCGMGRGEFVTSRGTAHASMTKYRCPICKKTWEHYSEA